MIAQNFVIDYALAKAQGVSQSEALKLALVASSFRPSFGMLVAFALAREEAPRPIPVTSGGYPGYPTGYTSHGFRSLFRRKLMAPPTAATAAPTISLGLQPLQQAVATAGVPSLQGFDKAGVEAWAHALNLTPVYEGGITTGKVEWQEPGAGKQPQGNTLKVRLK